MASAHTRKERIIVVFCFDTAWIKGFCFGTMRTKTEVVSDVKEKVAEACKETTACRLEVRHTTGTGPKDMKWAIWVDYSGFEAPRGCRIRDIERAATAAMLRALEDLR